MRVSGNSPIWLVLQIALCGNLMLLSLFSFVAWHFDASQVLTFMPGLPGIHPLASLQFFLLGLSLALSLASRTAAFAPQISKFLVPSLQILVVVLSSAQAMHWLLGTPAIDHALFGVIEIRWHGGDYLVRTSPQTSELLLLLGLSALVVCARRDSLSWLIQWLLNLLFIQAFISMAATVAGVQTAFTQLMSFNTALLAMLSAATVYNATYGTGILGFRSDTPIWRMIALYLIPALGLVVCSVVVYAMFDPKLKLMDSSDRLYFAILLFSAVISLFPFVLVRWVSRLETATNRLVDSLQQEQSKLNSAILATGSGLWRWSPKSPHWQMSAEVAAMLGYSVGELNKQFNSFCEPSCQNGSWDELVEKILRQDLSAELAARDPIQLQVISKSGDYVWLNITGHKRCNLSGEVEEITGIIRDITQEKVQESIIKESEEQIRTILDNLDFFVAMLDPKGRVVEINQAAILNSGYRLEQIKGRRLSETPWWNFDAEAQALLEQNLAMALEGLASSFQTRIRQADGTELNVDFRLSPRLSAEGDLQQIIASGSDVTERVAAEIALREASEAAQQANQAKSAFLATMSHEIRTPMNAIVGMLELMSFTPLNAEQKDTVRNVQDSAFNLLRLIDDILDFSKIESGHLTLEKIEIDTTDLVETVTNSLKGMAQKVGVDLMLQTAPDLPVHIYSDPTRLQQVLYNIVGNAVKFSGNRHYLRGRVTVGVEFEWQPSAALKITIEDNGIGMSASVRDRLFVSFSQGEYSTTRRFGGTGLGLAITDRIVRIMRGSIEVESQEGVGSTFTVTVPMESSGKPKPRAIKSPLPIYICLDDEEVERVVVRYLKAVDLQATILSAKQKLPIIAEPAAVVVVDGGTSTLFDTSDAVLSFIEMHSDNFELFSHRDRNIALIELAINSFCNFRDTLFNLLQRDKVKQLGVPPVEREAAVQEKSLIGYRLLVAEDDPTNQKVIRRQLQLLGCECEIVENGSLALSLWQRGKFDLILTDLHMPVLDGYGLVKAIRQKEAGRPPIPIIALTANALREEPTASKARGLDGYVTKPIRLKDLEKVLLDALKKDCNDDTAEAENVVVATNSATLPVDIAASVEATGLEFSDIMLLADDFLTTSRAQVEAAKAAMENNDSEALRVEMHKLKSGARAFGAKPLATICEKLEQSCIDGDTIPQAAVTTMVNRYEAVVTALNAIKLEQIPD